MVMDTDDAEWLEKFLQASAYEGAQASSLPQNTSPPNVAPPPAPRAPVPVPASIPPHMNNTSLYSSPYSQPETFVRPHQTMYYPPPSHSHPQRNYSSPSLAPTPTASAPPPQTAIPVPQYVPLNRPNTMNSHSNQDAKRRRIDKGRPRTLQNQPQLLPSQTQAPRMAPPARPHQPQPQPRPHPPSQFPGPINLANYTFAPRDQKDKDFLKARADIVKPFNDKDAMKRETYDSKTIARDVLIAAGRHIRDKPLNHHLFRLRDIFINVDYTSDLETFRWDLVDPRESVANHFTPPPVPRDAPRPIVAPPPASSTAARPMQQQLSTPAIPPNIHYPPDPPRSSIPPHYPHTTSSISRPVVSAPPIQKAPPPVQKPEPLVQKPQPPVQKSTPQPKPSNPPQQLKQMQPPKPAQPLSRVEVMIGKRQPTRGPGNSKVAINVPPPVTYQVYSCDWQGCQAELHNLEMLKQHLLKIHIPFHIDCRWKECSCEKKMAAVELFQHIQKEHLGPIAWKLGDGPSVRGTAGSEFGSGSPGPLSTPEANQPGGEDSLIFPASYSSIRAFNRVHGNHSQQEKAREILKAVQRLKERIGVGLDPGGCQLATPARIERVSNDEEFYEVIE